MPKRDNHAGNKDITFGAQLENREKTNQQPAYQHRTNKGHPKALESGLVKLKKGWRFPLTNNFSTTSHQFLDKFQSFPIVRKREENPTHWSNCA